MTMAIVNQNKKCILPTIQSFILEEFHHVSASCNLMNIKGPPVDAKFSKLTVSNCVLMRHDLINQYLNRLS